MNYSSFIQSNIIPKIKGRLCGMEYIGESPFQDNDYKCHFSINIESGLWQDFKLGTGGNIYQLVSKMYNLSYGQAWTNIHLSIFSDNEIIQNHEVTPTTSVSRILEESKAELVEDSWLDSSGIKFDAIGFLIKRNIYHYCPFYLGTEGILKDRLIIPYIKDNKIFYYQARSLRIDLMPKYLTPPVDAGIKKSNILHPYENKNVPLIVTEGVIDVLSLKMNGYNATCIGGTSISSSQMDELKSYPGEIVLGFNNDNPAKYKETPPGLNAVRKFINMSLRKCFNKKLSYCFPPNPYKDWNEMHVAGANIVNAIDNRKEVTFLTMCELFKEQV